MTSSNPQVGSPGAAGEGSVLDLLAPLRASYISRTPREDDWLRQACDVAHAVTAPEARSISCTVEAVVTVDPEGRIPWRFHFDGLDISDVGLSLGKVEGLIDVSVHRWQDGLRRGRDRYGRLHLPQGLLRSIGCWPEDRLAVARLQDRQGVVLVRADRLSIRAGPE